MRFHCTDLYTVHTCTPYTPVHRTHLYTVHTCTPYTPIHCTHLYTVHTCTPYTPVHRTHLYTVHTYTPYTPGHCTYLYTVHTCTLYIRVHCTHLYTLHTCTPYTPVVLPAISRHFRFLYNSPRSPCMQRTGCGYGCRKDLSLNHSTVARNSNRTHLSTVLVICKNQEHNFYYCNTVVPVWLDFECYYRN